MLDTRGTTVLIASAKEPPINVLEYKTMISQMMNKMTNPVTLIIVVEAKAEGKDRSHSRGKNDRGTSSEDKKSKRSQRQVKASYCDTTDVTSPILGIPLSSFEESRPPTKRPVRIIKRICLADVDEDDEDYWFSNVHRHEACQQEAWYRTELA